MPLVHAGPWPWPGPGRCRGNARRGEANADIDLLRHQASALGPVASPPTVWRALDEVSTARLKKIATARARVRRHVWSRVPGGLPASRIAGTDLGDGIALSAVAINVSIRSLIDMSRRGLHGR